MKNKLSKKISDLLIIVIVLAMVALVISGMVIKRGKQYQTNESKKESIHFIQNSLEGFYEDNGLYPQNLSELELNNINIEHDFVYLPNHNLQMYVIRVALENPKKTDINVFKKDNIWYYELNSMQ